MANVFTRSNNATPAPSRNTFDGSFVNNLTLKAGQLTPCFCKEVIPGDSFKIDSTFGFNMMPMIFPVQTEMQCSLHFFYVRNRALWKGWQDFITKTNNKDGDSVPPYIHLTSMNREMFNTGNIGDFLGVPTVYYSNQYSQVKSPTHINPLDSSWIENTNYVYGSLAFSFGNPVDHWKKYSSESDISETERAEHFKNLVVYSRSQANNYGVYPQPWEVNTAVPSSRISVYGRQKVPVGTVNFTYTAAQIKYLFDTLKTYNQHDICAETIADIADNRSCYDIVLVVKKSDYTPVAWAFGDHGLSTEYWLYKSAEYAATSPAMISFVVPSDEELEVFFFQTAFITTTLSGASLGSSTAITTFIVDAGTGIENSEKDLADLPFVSDSNADGLRVSALPFRAYEAIYNSFYRDDRNNPLMINGEPYYNVWNTTTDGGKDTTHYKLYQKNWEQDVFTTAVQSPQQGVAPLVGVTATGAMEFQDEEGKSYYLQAEFAEDGHTISGIRSYSSDMPAGTLRAMVDTISTGISINDFRNVNALQRWLECNMRKGLRYKDQIEAHFGVSPTYSELDMPEFIGGVSRKIEMNRVTQTSQSTSDSPLGSLGGSATVLGQGGAPVTKYCDEHGWIIGIVCVTPKPVYSQQLNKQLLKSNVLDFYFPEFAHIGYQPILNQEIAPLQCTSNTGEALSDVFGYQRAWYEYLANVDEVHGAFRNSLRHYIINRVFNGVPQLGSEFLTVSTEEVNEVFAVEDDTDKIFGQIYFDVKMKRPIPAIGIPKLEVG